MEKKKNGNGNGRKWTEEEVKILIEMNEKLHGTEPLKDIFKDIVTELNKPKFINKRKFERTEKGVKWKYLDLKNNHGYTNGDGKKNPWTREEEKFLKDSLQDPLTSRKEIYDHFLKTIPLRSKESVRNKIRNLDKKFVKELLQQIEDYDEEEQKRWREIYDLLTKDEGEKKHVKLKL